jgi:hypothetical protein
VVRSIFEYTTLGCLNSCSLFVLIEASDLRLGMPDIEFIRGEIERMRAQLGRQRREILQLQRAGIATASAEALLQRMLDKVDSLCAQRDKLKAAQKHPMKGKVLGGRQW